LSIRERRFFDLTREAVLVVVDVVEQESREDIANATMLKRELTVARSSV
jgi:hypothetical protein